MLLKAPGMPDLEVSLHQRSAKACRSKMLVAETPGNQGGGSGKPNQRSEVRELSGKESGTGSGTSSCL